MRVLYMGQSLPAIRRLDEGEARAGFDRFGHRVVPTIFRKTTQEFSHVLLCVSTIQRARLYESLN